MLGKCDSFMSTSSIERFSFVSFRFVCSSTLFLENSSSCCRSRKAREEGGDVEEERGDVRGGEDEREEEIDWVGVAEECGVAMKEEVVSLSFPLSLRFGELAAVLDKKTTKKKVNETKRNEKKMSDMCTVQTAGM